MATLTDNRFGPSFRRLRQAGFSLLLPLVVGCTEGPEVRRPPPLPPCVATCGGAPLPAGGDNCVCIGSSADAVCNDLGWGLAPNCQLRGEWVCDADRVPSLRGHRRCDEGVGHGR